MDPQIDNAVAHYERLREQGVKPSAALEGTRLRFGIDKTVLMRRVNGFVADHEATMQALAEAKDLLGRDWTSARLEVLEVVGVLDDLYTAITGESL